MTPHLELSLGTGGTGGKDGDDDAAAPAVPKHQLEERTADLKDFTDTVAAYRTLAVGEVERARDGAKTVQNAASLLAGLYSGLIGVTFAVTETPVPPRGVLAPVFLGASIVLSTAYLAWRTPAEDLTEGPLGEEPRARPRMLARASWLASVTHRSATRHSGPLRASVVALALGLVLSVLPFIDVGTSTTYPDPMPALPEPTLAPGWDPALAELRYAADLAEAQEARAPEVTPNSVADGWLTGVAALVGLLLVALAWRVGNRAPSAQAPVPPAQHVLEAGPPVGGTA